MSFNFKKRSNGISWYFIQWYIYYGKPSKKSAKLRTSAEPLRPPPLLNFGRLIWLKFFSVQLCLELLSLVYNVHVLKDQKYDMYIDTWIFNVYFHVSDGIDQFKLIFEYIKISNNMVRTVGLSGQTPPCSANVRSLALFFMAS